MTPKDNTTASQVKPKDENAGKSQAQLDKEAAKKVDGNADEVKANVAEAAKLSEKSDDAQRVSDHLASEADAKKQTASVAGSPVTAGTTSSTDASGAQEATAGNFSPTTVAGNADNSPKTMDAAAKNAQGELLTDGPTIKEWVDRGYRASAYPPHGYEPKSSDEEIQHYLKLENGDPETIDDDLADKLDAATGHTTSDNDDVTKPAAKTLKPRATSTEPEIEEEDDERRGAMARLRRYVDGLSDRKDDFIVHGYSNMQLTIGDLRHLVK